MMMTVLATVLSHPEVIGLVLGIIHALALAYVNMTPTPDDNTAYGKIYKVIEMLAGVFGVTIKEFPRSREMKERIRHRETNMKEIDRWLGLNKE